MTVVMLEREDCETPFGVVSLVARGEQLCHVAFPSCRQKAAGWLQRRFGTVTYRPGGMAAAAARALGDYLNGRLDALERIPLDPGGSPFQRQIWEAVRRIPPGHTMAYSEIARCLDNPGAVRAVGRANGDNPIPLFIPCHRVIGVQGRLTGFGGGLETKRWLLAHEGVRPAPQPSKPGAMLPFG